MRCFLVNLNAKPHEYWDCTYYLNLSVHSSATNHLNAQRGLFTLESKDEPRELNKNRLVASNLVKYKISHSHIEDVLDQLDNLGINQASIFPTYDGVGRYTKENLKAGRYKKT
jgi:hypothetical protein